MHADCIVLSEIVFIVNDKNILTHKNTFFNIRIRHNFKKMSVSDIFLDKTALNFYNKFRVVFGLNINIPKNRIYSVNIENVTVEMIIEGGIECSSENLIQMIPHTHAYIEIFACDCSNAVISTEKGDIFLNEGDIGIIPLELKHRMTSSTGICHAFGVRFVRRNITGNTDLYGKLNGFCSSENGVIIKNHMDICRSLANLHSAEDSEEYMPALRLALLLCELADKYGECGNDFSAALPDKDLNRITQLDGIINAYYMTNLTVSSVAERLFISQRQLSRIVKKRYNATLHQVLINKRLETAAKMLAKSSDSVYEISQKTGFGSVHGFCRNFEKQYGVTPSEYRKNSGKV